MQHPPEGDDEPPPNIATCCKANGDVCRFGPSGTFTQGHIVILADRQVRRIPFEAREQETCKGDILELGWATKVKNTTGQMNTSQDTPSFAMSTDKYAGVNGDMDNAIARAHRALNHLDIDTLQTLVQAYYNHEPRNGTTASSTAAACPFILIDAEREVLVMGNDYVAALEHLDLARYYGPKMRATNSTMDHLWATWSQLCSNTPPWNSTDQEGPHYYAVEAAQDIMYMALTTPPHAARTLKDVMSPLIRYTTANLPQHPPTGRAIMHAVAKIIEDVPPPHPRMDKAWEEYGEEEGPTYGHICYILRTVDRTKSQDTNALKMRKKAVKEINKYAKKALQPPIHATKDYPSDGAEEND